MKKIRVIHNWKSTIKYAWSLRLMALSGVCSVGEIFVAYYPDALPRGAMAGLAGSFALGGIIAKFFSQRNMSDE
jgi:hypothetical protein